MRAVRNWLEEIGLGQYADAFETNDIDTNIAQFLSPPDAGRVAIKTDHHSWLDFRVDGLDQSLLRETLARMIVYWALPQLTRPA
jgi:hypothetical protein